MKAWFLSDLHLKNMKERNGEILLRFLRSLPSQIGTSTVPIQQPPSSDFTEVLNLQKIKSRDPQHYLFLLGDIFDIWVSDHSIFVNEYLPLIEEIQLLLQKNFRVIYFEGNHDMHIDRFWTRQLGVEVYDDTAFFDLDGFHVRAEHGDLINLNDKKHLRSRQILRHPGMEFLGHYLPGLFWRWLAQKYSHKSRSRSAQYRQHNQEDIRTMIRHHAERSYSERTFDLIITGHMHVFDDFTFNRDGKEIRSINLGSWLEEPRVLKITKSPTDLTPQIEWQDPTRLE